MRPPNNLEKKIPLETCDTFQLECKKVQVHCSLEQSLEHNQDQPFLKNSWLVTPFLTSWGVTETLSSFRLVPEVIKSKVKICH